MATETWVSNTAAKSLKSTLAGTELLRIGDSGTSKRTRVSDIADYMRGRANTFTAAQTFSNTTTFSGAATFNANLTVDTNVLHVDTATNRVGIGTTSPIEALHVNGEMVIAVNSSFYSNLYYDGGFKYIANGPGGYIKMANTGASPNVFEIGMAPINAGGANAAAALDRFLVVQATDKLMKLGVAENFEISSTGALKAGVYGAGTLQTDASGNITASSDERLKDEIEPFTAGLDEVMALSPISYRWAVRSGLDRMNKYAGFSAQNVSAAIPEAVGIGGDGYLTVNDRPIIAALVNAVRTLADEIETLKAGA